MSQFSCITFLAAPWSHWGAVAVCWSLERQTGGGRQASKKHSALELRRFGDVLDNYQSTWQTASPGKAEALERPAGGLKLGALQQQQLASIHCKSSFEGGGLPWCPLCGLAQPCCLPCLLCCHVVHCVDLCNLALFQVSLLAILSIVWTSCNKTQTKWSSWGNNTCTHTHTFYGQCIDLIIADQSFHTHNCKTWNGG